MIDRSSSLLSTFETILKMVAHFRAVARLNSYRNGGLNPDRIGGSTRGGTFTRHCQKQE